MSEVPGLERSRPNAPDAERGLVACLLLDDEGLVATRCLEEGLRPEAFYTPALQLIYAAYMSLLEEGRGLDMVTINERLTESGDAEQTGGFPALTRISMAVETTAHARAWIKLVRDAGCSASRYGCWRMRWRRPGSLRWISGDLGMRCCRC